MEQYTPMKSLRLKSCFAFCFSLFDNTTHSAEQVSLKFSFMTNSINGNDVNTWIASSNRLWQDVKLSRGGDLQGQFNSIDFGSTWNSSSGSPSTGVLPSILPAVIFQAAQKGKSISKTQMDRKRRVSL